MELYKRKHNILENASCDTDYITYVKMLIWKPNSKLHAGVCLNKKR
jgi:hypothetical protein